LLQAGFSKVHFANLYFNWSNFSSRTTDLVSTRPVTDISTRNLLASKRRPARKADKLTAVCEPTAYKMWELRVSQPCEPRRLTKGQLHPLGRTELGSILRSHSAKPFLLGQWKALDFFPEYYSALVRVNEELLERKVAAPV
jgi:hypothetical protein